MIPPACSPQGSSVRRILQARIPEWVATSSSRVSSRPRDQTHESCIAGEFFTTEPRGKLGGMDMTSLDTHAMLTACFPLHLWTKKCLWSFPLIQKIELESGFPGGSVVKNSPAMQETPARSLGQENPLEKEMATHSSFLPGKSHRQRNLAGYGPWGLRSVGHN